MNEEEIIAKVRRGDLTAFEELFEKYKVSALRTVYLITGNIHTSEDIVQESFIKCFYSIKSLKDDKSFKPWFFKILTRTAWKFSKSDKKVIPIEDIYEKYDREDLTKTEDILIEGEESKVIHKAIETLDIKRKTTIILYYFDNLSVKEIAKIMNCFEGTVKSRLHTARKALKKQFEKLEKRDEAILKKGCDESEAVRFY